MKVLVTNIPLRAFTSGWVEVPDGTTDEAMSDAIADSIYEHGYKTHGAPNGFELDEAPIENGWEFTVEKRESNG